MSLLDLDKELNRNTDICFIIDGTLQVPRDLTLDQVHNMFIEWVDQNKWKFGGSIHECEEDSGVEYCGY